MSRYKGARLRIIRRLGQLPLGKVPGGGPKSKINKKFKLPGFTSKTTNRAEGPGKRKERPGQHVTYKKKPSQYGIRLEEKQKIRYNYGITEQKLIRYVQQAKKLKGSTGNNLLQLLEMRLDNIVFRFGFAPTIGAARQLITHGHFMVNHKKVTIPSYQCVSKEVISVAKKKKSLNLIKSFLLQSKKPKRSFLYNKKKVTPHLQIDKQNVKGKINSIVKRNCVELQMNELLVVEFYSRKV